MIGTTSENGTAIKYSSKSAELKRCSVKGRKIYIQASLEDANPNDISSAILKYDSEEKDATIELQTSVDKSAKGCTVTMSIDADEAVFFPLRWTLLIGTEGEGEREYRYVKCSNKRKKILINNRNIKLDMPGNHVLFPYISKGGKLKISYREASKYDGAKIKQREIMAMLALKTHGRALRERRNYIIYEKFCETAQDNSYYFFKYCMDNLPEEEKKRFYYVIDKDSPERGRLKGYEKNVIDFMSIKHMLYAMTAELCISTDTIQHLYAWKSKLGPVNRRIYEKDLMFLQHGVTMLKKVDQSFGAHGQYPMKYFVTTSEKEQRIVLDNFGYEEANVPVTGFARWDALTDKRDDADRFILIMPTWRPWIENMTDDEFRQSDYYEHYVGLMTDKAFVSTLKKNDLRAVFYMHPKFADRVRLFDIKTDDAVDIVTPGSTPMNEYIMKCHMLITDYSSVCWDVLYLDKPVLFYQFDYKRYMSELGSYIDMENDLPGERVFDVEKLSSVVEKYAIKKFDLKEDEMLRLQEYFPHKDTFNSERIYCFVLECEKLRYQ